MESSASKASIILATYQWPEALALVLSGLLTQSEQDFEVLIADDGSDQRTRAIIEAYRARAKFRIEHLWQEDQGFRKCRILNEAIRASRGRTLIFLDGDCVPHRHFVGQHCTLVDPSHYVAGRRVDLSPEFTARLTPARIEKGMLNGMARGLLALWKDSLRKGGSTPFHRAYMVRNPLFRRVFGLEKVVDLKGCNFSVLRSHMLAIDGFDETYEGYGREDTDVEIRLQHLGLKIKSAKNLCLQFHLWHKQKDFTNANEHLLEEVKRSGRVKAVRGMGATA